MQVIKLSALPISTEFRRPDEPPRYMLDWTFISCVLPLNKFIIKDLNSFFGVIITP